MYINTNQIDADRFDALGLPENRWVRVLDGDESDPREIGEPMSIDEMLDEIGDDYAQIVVTKGTPEHERLSAISGARVERGHWTGEASVYINEDDE